MHDEGVIKFQVEHVADASVSFPADVVEKLAGWRALLHDLGLVGQDRTRYGGAGFGNLSFKLNGPGFVVTGSQTGGQRVLRQADWCLVESFSARANVVHSRGPILPSSETMTHGSIYAVRPQTRVIIHVHSSLIWRFASDLDLPATAPHVAYGTPDMAKEVARLFAETHVARGRAFAMAGHEDGVVSFGATVEDAATALLGKLARAQRYLKG
jgi:ribulose-5-phosphate 4-epimerase/fuculose-1-phosphate aldolase